VEFDVKPEWVGETLVDLNLRKKYSINVIAIQKDNDVTTEIDPNKPLEAKMKLIVVANRNKLEKMR
jgi:trk system potassium uptake protein TrkA